MENRWEPDAHEKLGILYEQRVGDTAPFECIKQYLRYPAKFRHAERTLIADLPKSAHEGRNVKVFETRCAASFFTVVVLHVDRCADVGRAARAYSLNLSHNRISFCSDIRWIRRGHAGNVDSRANGRG